MNRLDERLFEHLFVREKSIRVSKMIDQRIVLARRHWSVERQMRVRDCQRAGDFFFCYSEAFCDLEMCRLPAKVLQQHGSAFPDTMNISGAIERNANDSGLLRERLEYRLANPPYRVRNEFDTLGLVESPSGAHETQVSLVDKVGKIDALVLIFLGDGNNKTEIGTNKLVHALVVARANPDRQLSFGLSRDQRISADVAQVLIQQSIISRILSLAGQLHLF